MSFKEYIDAFNSGDDNGLVERYFTEDFVYEGGARKIEGREAWLGFLHFAHDGLREIFRPVTSFDGPTGHFCEIDMDFHAIKPRPEFPFGPLAAGDMYTVKFFVIYERETGGNRFCRLKAATWPANQGTSTLPRLGSHVTQRAAFQALAGAFGYGDGSNAAQYFHELVALEQDGHETNGTPLDAIAQLRRQGGQDLVLETASDVELVARHASGSIRFGLGGGLIVKVSWVR